MPADHINEPGQNPKSGVSASQVDATANEKRKGLLIRLGAIIAGLVVIYGLYYVLYDSHFVSTDNAYVGAETAQVNALATGPVARILVTETQAVKQGDPLLELDNTEAQNTVAASSANLALTRRKVESYFATSQALSGQVGQRSAQIDAAQAQISAAQADYDKARTELQRRQPLVESGAISKDELTNAQDALAKAQAAMSAALAQKTEAEAGLTAAKGTLLTNQSLISGATIDNNPEVMASQTRLDAAKLILERTIVRAPTDGVIARKVVQVGQQVAIGTPLMSIVPLDRVYVDANFKEVQLKKVVPGQAVELTSDYYGKGVKFHGKVVGISGGTGSAFSLIPTQNATGNWIKVVQRLSVRVALDPAELKAHPLRVGLSMSARIDITK